MYKKSCNRRSNNVVCNCSRARQTNTIAHAAFAAAGASSRKKRIRTTNGYGSEGERGSGEVGNCGIGGIAAKLTRLTKYGASNEITIPIKNAIARHSVNYTIRFLAAWLPLSRPPHPTALVLLRSLSRSSLSVSRCSFREIV